MSKNIFSLRGRIGRLEFVVVTVAMLVFGMVLFGLGMYFKTSLLSQVGLLFSIYALLIVPIRRFQDMGWSGLNVLALFIPLLNVFYLFKLLFSKGIQGENKYGMDPLVKEVIV